MQLGNRLSARIPVQFRNMKSPTPTVLGFHEIFQSPIFCHKRPWLRATWLVPLALIAVCGSLAAQTERNWILSTGTGEWFEEENWQDENIPTAGERAIFNLGANPPYTVELDDTVTIDSLRVNQDNMVLDLAGQAMNLTATGNGPADLGLGIGMDEDDNATMTLQGGATLTTVQMRLGSDADAVGNLTLQGNNTRLQVNSQGNTFLGLNGTAFLTIRSGAELRVDSATNDQVNVANNSSSSATILVESGGSLVIENPSSLDLRSGSYDVTVRDDGYLFARNLRFFGSNGTVTVDDGEIELQLNLEMGRANSGTDRVDILNGGVVEAQGSLLMGWTSSGSTSILEVSGSNATDPSRLLIAQQGRLGIRSKTQTGGGVGHLIVADGGVVTFGEWLHIDSNSILEVDGGTVTASRLDAEFPSTIALTLHTGVFDAPIRILEGSLNGDVNLSADDSLFDLSLATGFTANLHDVFGVIRYEGALDGMFHGLNEGDILTVGGYEFQFSYGSGNDSLMTLTVIPEPHGVILALLALGGLLSRRKFQLFGKNRSLR